ncbi:hypothetical protein MJO29_016727 [Puccinia striiformis f. sp. tritici]|nr:hypothetical protein MJO29_016727 [Puccinia striiformis f. sp. tritici]
MGVEHSPKGKNSELPITIDEKPPMNPANQEKYTAEEYAAMTSAERQWLRNRPYHAEDGVVLDLIDYDDPVGSSLASSSETIRVEAALTSAFNQMNVDNNPTAPAQPPAQHHRPVPAFPTPSQPARLPSMVVPQTMQPAAPRPVVPEFHIERVIDPSKVLKNWPETDSPKFTGAAGESAQDWLRTIEVLLDDRQAHRGIWHRCAGQRLSKKPFRDWTDASLTRIRPTNWEDFQEWLIRLNPLGTTPALLNSELNHLRQGPNEAVQLFYERFSDWQTRARTMGFPHEEQTAFIQRLNPGLSKKVSEWVTSQQCAGAAVAMDQIFLFAVSNDQHYRDSQAAPVAGGSGLGKRRADGQGGGTTKKKGPFACHNCKATDHQVSKCPEPNNLKTIEENLPEPHCEKSHREFESAEPDANRPGMGIAASDELRPDEKSLVVATNVVCDCLCTDGCHAAELASDEPQGVRAEFHHRVEGRLARILLDTGAGSSYVSNSFVSDVGLLISRSAESFKVTGAFGDRISDDRLATVRFKLAEVSFAVVCRLAPLSSYDVILGRDWIASNVVSTDWSTNTWYLNSHSGKVVEFHLALSSECSIITHELAVMSDEDEVLLPRSIRRHEFYEGARESFICLMESEGVAGPRDDLPVGLPTVFGSDVTLQKPLQSLVTRFAEVFGPIAKVSDKPRTIEHLVQTGDAQPVHQPVRQLSPALLGTLKERLAGLQEAGFIRPSTSAWSSPIVMVKHPTSGKVRLCVDYRKVNALTKKDRHPLPIIQECFDSLRGARFFSKIDLQQGFHQMKIAETDVPKTAFGTKYGHFEWLVMPFGLVNAPSTFQRMMTSLLREFIDVYVQVYLDDILIYSKSESDHIRHVESVLEILRREELRCSGAKCSFGLREIQYVGHVIGYNSIRPMEEKRVSVREWPRPQTVFDVRSFLGLCGFYRRYVKNFAKIAAPLHDLTAGGVTRRQSVQWLPIQEVAFKQLKEALTSAPILLMPDALKKFVMETDASDFAVGAVLLQDGDDLVLHPVAFESCKLNKAQVNYPAQERELLAIIHAWRKWHVYLDGAVETTVVYTDHASLAYLSTQLLPTKRLLRWIEEFSEMDIEVRYKKGVDNIVPDALSRRSDLALLEEVTDQLHESDWPLIIPYLVDERDLPEGIPERLVIRARENQKLFEYDPDSESLMYLGRKGLEERSPFVAFAYRFDLLRSLHDDLGHRGRDSVLQNLRGRGWWPKRYDDVQSYVRTCASCQVNERPHSNQETGLQKPLPAVLPFERWSSDLIQMPESCKGKFKWILTAIDHCTSWPVAVPLQNATAAELAQAIFDQIITPFGVPKEFLTDRGSNYLSKGFQKFLVAAGMKPVRTSGYHPQTNGKSERFNGILEAALFRLNTTGDPSKWEDVFPAALFSTRIHVSDSSGFSPFELLYGVKPRLPQDRRRMIAAEPALPGHEELKTRINELNKTRITATGNTAVRALKNKEVFDAKTSFARDLDGLVLGQSVKLRNEKHTKGDPKWFGPFTITKLLDNNVYIVADHDGVEYPRPVNGNSLKPVALRSLIVNDMWAAPPAIAQREKRADAKVARDLLRKTKSLAKTKKTNSKRNCPVSTGDASATSQVDPAKLPARRLRLRLGPPPTGSGTDPA